MTGNGQDPNSNKQKKPVVVRRRRSRSPRPRTPSLDTVAVERKKQSAQTPGLFMFTLLFCYKSLYLYGITLARRWLRYRRRLRVGLLGFREAVRSLAGRFWRALGRIWKGFLRRLTLPFVRVRNVRAQMRPVIERSRRDGKVPLRAYGRIVTTFFRLLYTLLRTVVNYGTPILVGYFVYQYVAVELQKPMGLLVEYNGATLGYIENEAEFEAAARILKDRYISDDAETLIASPTFQLVELPEGESYTEARELANSIVYASSSEIEWGYGLYIDNTFYGAVTSFEDYIEIYDELEALKVAHSTGEEGEELEFVKPLKIEEGLYPLGSIVEEEELLEVIHATETVNEYYIVEEGDSPSLVADKTGIPLATLESLNGDLSEMMFAGERILTQVAQPFLSVMNSYITVYREEIAYSVEEIPTELYGPSYRSIEQEGVPGVQEVTAQISAVNGVVVNQTVLDVQTITAPVTEKVIIGTQTYAPSTSSTTPSPGSSGTPATSSGGFMWPTDGGSMTTYPGHTGVDISRPIGTNIYAARSGQVILSRATYTGYGHYIMVDHGDGYVTLYAHASALYVNVGDWVNQGQIIAAVGSTGNSSGPHLHFEVRYNGQIMNPRNYIG